MLTIERLHLFNTPYQHIAADAGQNNSGGLLCIWNLSFFQLEANYVGSRWISLVGTIIPFDWLCIVGVVYGGYIVDE